MRRLLLPALCVALASNARALIDTNTNGLSDLWEKAFNANTLFSAVNADHTPFADPDGDGWTNHQEATAGTNPFDANNAQGILTPAVSHTPAIREPAPPGANIGQIAETPPPTDPNDPFGGAEASVTTASNPLEIRRPTRFTLTWPTIAGKAYRIDHSTDLEAWTPSSGFFMGEGVPLTYTGEAIHTDNTEPAKLFYRIIIEEADSDGDSLTDWEEGVLGTDRFSTDSDRDGTADNLDPEPLVNSLLGIWNIDTSDPTGAALFASFNFTPPASGGYPFTAERVTDSSGNSRHGKARSQSLTTPPPQNPPQENAEGIATHGFHFSNTHHFAFEQKNPGINFAPVSSLSFWLKTKASDLEGNGQPVFSYVPKLGVFAQIINTANPYAARAFIRKQPAGTGYEVVWLDWTYPGNTVRERWTLDLAPAQLGDRWLNLTFVWQGGSGSGQNSYWACYANGVKQTRTLGSTLRFQATAATPNTPQDTFVIGADAAGGTGQDNLATIQSTFKGAMDRVRFHTAGLTAFQVETIARQDADNDGLWDSTEASATAWRDSNGNGKRDPGEILYPNGSPVHWQHADTDSDEDRIPDLAEQSLGTRIDRTDTDGDRLPDGWEIAHNLNPLDATGANGQNGDPDGDGLANLDEYRFNSKPNSIPGDPLAGQPGSAWDSDGDGTNDNSEFLQGSHAGNADDDGLPLPAAERVSVKLGIGDVSDSKSEDYSMEVSRINPDTGDEELFYTLHSGGFGEFEEKTLDIFRKGQTYTYRIIWNDTNKASSEGPDLDYTFRVQPQGNDTGFLIDGYDIRRGIADSTEKLIGENLQNVATDELAFREKFQNRRVVLMGVSTLSSDRMFGASMQMLPGLEGIQLEITNTVTNEDFGTHSQLFAKAYKDYEEILGHGDNFGKDVADPRVWFIQTFNGSLGGIQAYLCADPAQAPGEIKISASFNGTPLGSVRHMLATDADGAAFIGRIQGLAAGTGLGFPLDQGHGANAAAAPGQPHHWAGAFAAPVLMAGKAIEGQTVMFTGVYDGVVAGLTDDWKMLILIKDGLVSGGNWLAPRAEAYLKAWREDPISRLREIKDGLTRFMKNQVCDKLGAAAVELGTVQGFLDTVWGLTPPGMFVKAPARFEALVGEDPWTLLSEAVAGWFDDFGTRMLNGAEQAAWVAEPFPDNALITGTIAYMNEMRYTFGYVFGYLAEQATVGLVSGKAVTLTASMTLKGVKLAAANATRLATRTGATIAAKGAVLKKAVAPVALSAALRASLEEGFVLAARTPTPGAAGKNILSVIEESYRALPGPAPAATISKLVDDIVAKPRLAALAAQPGGSLEILKATARVHNRASTTAASDGVINWPKLADRLIKEDASGNLVTRFDDVFSIFKVDTSEGAQAFAKSLKEFIDGGGKFWIRNVDEMYETAYKYSSFSPTGGWSNYSGVLQNPTWCSFKKIDTPELANDLLLLPGASTNPRYRVEFATTQIKDRTRMARGNGEDVAEIIFEPYTKDIPPGFVNAGTGMLGNTNQIIVEGAVDVDRVIDMITGLVVWSRN